MKKKHLFFALAAALTLAACNKQEDLGLARIEVSPTALSFGTAAATQSITVTATRDWKADDVPDWIALDPASGKASTKPQSVNVTVTANPGFNRESEFALTIGMSKQYLKVTQSGDKGELDTGNGTMERPYIPSAAYAYVSSLQADVEAGPIYIKGTISNIAMTFEASGTYGNANFYISDDGTASGSQFYVFQTYYLENKMWTAGNDDIKVGDEVIICGKVVNYRGNTPETVNKGGSYIYALNGETKRKDADIDYSKAEPKTVAEFIQKGDKTNYYKLTGKVSSFSAAYCSFDLTDDTGSIYVYSVANKSDWSDKIKNGGTVVLAGQYDYYTAKSQHEVINAQILSFEEGTTPQGEPKGSGTLEDPYNPAGANAYIATLPADKESEKEVYIKGKVSEVREAFSAQFGNATFYLTEDGSKDQESFYVFQTLYLGNVKWVEGNDQVKVGDEMIICGKVINYKGNTPETSARNSYIYSWNGKTVDPAGPDPVKTDLASIIKAEDNTPVASEGVTVVAVSSRGYIATDGKNNIHVYENKIPTVAVGDVVNFSGTKTTYDGVAEVISPTTTKTGTAEVTYPEPVDITANFAQFTSPESVYVKYTGKMYKNGSYTNFSVQGSPDLSGALSSAPDIFYNGLNEGDDVVVYGYFSGVNTSNKILNVIVVKIEDKTTGKVIPGDDPTPPAPQADVVITTASLGYENGTAVTEIKSGDIVITFDKGTNSNAPKYYTTGSAIRLYGSNSMTITSIGKQIAEVTLEFASGEGTNEITATPGTWASATSTWTGPAAAVTFTVGGTSGHRRVAKILINYVQ